MSSPSVSGGAIVLPSPSLATRGGVVGKHHFTGELVADFGASKVVYFESHLEMQVIEIFRARPDVANIVEQPRRVPWRDGRDRVRHHTFDMLVTMTDGVRVAVAVKPAAKVRSSRIEVVLAEIAAQLDPAFADHVVLVTDRDIDPVDLRNAVLLNRLSRVDPSALEAASRVTDELGGDARIGDIARRVGKGPSGARAVLRLIRDGALVPVGKGLITPQTVVRPVRCVA